MGDNRYESSARHCEWCDKVPLYQEWGGQPRRWHGACREHRAKLLPYVRQAVKRVEDFVVWAATREATS